MKYITCGELSNMLPLYFPDRGLQAAGKIKGRFRNSLHIEFPVAELSASRESQDSFLLHIGSLSRPLCAFGLSIKEEEVRAMAKACEEGNLAYKKKGKLVIYGREEQFSIELPPEGNFYVRDLKVPRSCPGSSFPANKSLYRLLLKEIEGEDWKSHMGIPWDERFFHYSSMLERGEGLKEAAAFFCGRGQGLTPGGDDILLGYGAVLEAAGEKDGFWLSDFLTDYAALKTTEVSRAYYRALSAGFVNEDFKRFLFCLSEKGRTEGEETIRQIKGLGHTSGHDTLYGAFLALGRLVSRTLH